MSTEEKKAVIDDTNAAVTPDAPSASDNPTGQTEKKTRSEAVKAANEAKKKRKNDIKQQRLQRLHPHLYKKTEGVESEDVKVEEDSSSETIPKKARKSEDITGAPSVHQDIEQPIGGASEEVPDFRGAPSSSEKAE